LSCIVFAQLVLAPLTKGFTPQLLTYTFVVIFVLVQRHQNYECDYGLLRATCASSGA